MPCLDKNKSGISLPENAMAILKTLDRWILATVLQVSDYPYN